MKVNNITSFLLVLVFATIVIGTLFLIMHWPYSKEILLIGYCGLFMVYPKYAIDRPSGKIFSILKICGILLFAGFKVLLLFYPDQYGVFKLFSSIGILLFLVIKLYQYMGFENFQSTVGEKVVGIAFFVGSSILAIGILFKILHWPYSSLFTVVGVGTAAISFFLTLFTGEDN